MLFIRTSIKNVPAGSLPLSQAVWDFAVSRSLHQFHRIHLSIPGTLKQLAHVLVCRKPLRNASPLLEEGVLPVFTLHSLVGPFLPPAGCCFLPACMALFSTTGRCVPRAPVMPRGCKRCRDGLVSVTLLQKHSSSNDATSCCRCPLF